MNPEAVAQALGWALVLTNALYLLAIRFVVRGERERAAQIVESYANTDPDRAIAAAAAEIRSGK